MELRALLGSSGFFALPFYGWAEQALCQYRVAEGFTVNALNQQQIFTGRLINLPRKRWKCILSETVRCKKLFARPIPSFQ